MRARVCCATGWTWEYVGQFCTLPRLYALAEDGKLLSVAEVVGAFVGTKAKPKTADNQREQAELHAQQPVRTFKRPL